MSKTSDTSSYFQKWYEINRDDLNSRRRERYKNDPEYRERVQRGNRVTREKRKREITEEVREEREAVKMLSTGSWRTVEVEVDGVRTRLFTVGAMAKALGKSISTLRVWEQNGFIPKTPYRSSRGDRLYTLEMVESTQAALQEAGRLEIPGMRKKAPRSFVDHDVVFKGQTKPLRMRLYRVNTLAKALNRSSVTVVNMEKGNTLPRTPFLKSSVKHRLYTLDMIEVARAELVKMGWKLQNAGEREDYYFNVLEGWTKLGVMDARLADESESS